jgi:hypothetical protein
VGQKAKPQWELYTDEELQTGAERWGLTVLQERQRIRLLQSDYRQWPSELLAHLKKQHSTNLEFITFTLIQHTVVAWLKDGNGVSVDSSVSMREEALVAVA